MARVEYEHFCIDDYRKSKGKTANVNGFDKFIVFYGSIELDNNELREIGRKLLETGCIIQDPSKPKMVVLGSAIEKTLTGADLRSGDCWDNDTVAEVFMTHIKDKQ